MRICEIYDTISTVLRKSSLGTRGSTSTEIPKVHLLKTERRGKPLGYSTISYTRTLERILGEIWERVTYLRRSKVHVRLSGSGRRIRV